MKAGSTTPSVRAMTSLKTRLALGGFLPIVVAIYAVSGLLLMCLYPYQMTTDTASYISIARKYAGGYFYDAVNWVWSPLISWLLAPLIYFGIDPLHALKAIALMTGIAGLIACKRLFEGLSIPEKAQTIMLLALVPMFHAFSLVNPNPDLLLAVLLLYYVRFVLSRDYGKSPRDGVYCGLLGALAYFAKAYAFPFFALHFPLVSLCRHYSEKDPARRRSMRVSLCLGLVSFVLVSSAWIGILYVKYDRLTISTIGHYNFRLVNHESGLSFLYDGFVKPPDPYALSAWEDPTTLAEGHWKPLDATRVIENTAWRIGRNILETIDAYQAGSFFSMAIILFSLISLIGLSARVLLGDAVFLILTTILLLSSGYLPLIVDRRYLYFGILLIYTLGGCLLNRYGLGDRRKRMATIIVLCLSFAFVPLRDLRANTGVNKDIRSLATALVEQGVGGRIGSNGRYDQSLFLAYFIASGRDATYLGIPPPEISGYELDSIFRQHGIDYYLCWADHPCKLLPGYREVPSEGIESLRVYRVR